MGAQVFFNGNEHGGVGSFDNIFSGGSIISRRPSHYILTPSIFAGKTYPTFKPPREALPFYPENPYGNKEVRPFPPPPPPSGSANHTSCRIHVNFTREIFMPFVLVERCMLMYIFLTNIQEVKRRRTRTRTLRYRKTSQVKKVSRVSHDSVFM